MALKNCTNCGAPLNQSQWSADGQYKSCPKCSVENGQEHVYYKYPDNFGNTPKRASANHSEGPQSYCVPCRSDGISSVAKIMCNKIK